MGKLLYTDETFRIVQKHDFVVARRGLPHNYHSHFKKFAGAKQLIELYNKHLIPHNEYFRIAMRRITTDEEWERFTPQAEKQKYYNSNKGIRRK